MEKIVRGAYDEYNRSGRLFVAWEGAFIARVAREARKIGIRGTATRGFRVKTNLVLPAYRFVTESKTIDVGCLGYEFVEGGSASCIMDLYKVLAEYLSTCEISFGFPVLKAYEIDAPTLAARLRAAGVPDTHGHLARGLADLCVEIPKVHSRMDPIAALELEFRSCDEMCAPSAAAFAAYLAECGQSPFPTSAEGASPRD